MSFVIYKEEFIPGVAKKFTLWDEVSRDQDNASKAYLFGYYHGAYGIDFQHYAEDYSYEKTLGRQDALGDLELERILNGT